MVTTREIADDNSSISSTRWAFALVIKFDIIVIFGTIVAGLIGHFIGKPFDNGFYGSVAMLLGALTTLTTGAKALQGFETKCGQEKCGQEKSGADKTESVEATETVTEGK